MKLFLLALLIIMAGASQALCFTSAIQAVVSGTYTAAGGCSSCPSPTAQWDANKTTTDGFGPTTSTYSWCFTLASTKCVSGLSWEIFDLGHSSGTVVYELRSQSSSHPSATVLATCSVTEGAGIPDAYTQGTQSSCNLASLYTATAGDYCIVVKNGTSESYGVGYLTEGSNPSGWWTSSDGGSTWDNTSVYPATGKVLGCTP